MNSQEKDNNEQRNPKIKSYDVNPIKVIILGLIVIFLLAVIFYVGHDIFISSKKTPSPLEKNQSSLKISENKEFSQSKDKDREVVENNIKNTERVHYIYLFDNFVNDNYLKVRKGDLVIFQNMGKNVKAIRLDNELNITNNIYPQESWNITVNWTGVLPWKDSFNFYVRGKIESIE